MMMAHAPVSISFAPELELAHQMRECLLLEQAHLVSADVNALAAIPERKNAISSRLDALTDARLRELAASGYAPTAAGVQEWIETQDDRVQKEWRELMGVVADLKELNRTNGLLINQHLMRVQKALQSLSGRKSPEVYGRDGQHSPSAYTRNIAAT
jgi:flagella synthesis protein FlgN